MVDTGSWPYSWLYSVLSFLPFSLLSVSSKSLSTFRIRPSINNLLYAKPEVNTGACSLQIGNEMTQPREKAGPVSSQHRAAVATLEGGSVIAKFLDFSKQVR